MAGCSSPLISVAGVGKRYVLSRAARERTLVDSFGAALADLRDRMRGRNPANAFWALQDVSFDVAAGEVVGVIGNNGAGKSTLLKILSRITEPTTGSIRYAGRVGSLLEVGTGFHPELSGRDNIFLNGAILGMNRRDIVRCFDEIVDFAGVEAFIDTPVKRYSSGMYLRLAFAVSAFLDTEILLVDEVLAVGDVGFQKKCLARMGEVARDGRTILFVSHNLTAIKALCRRTLALAGGRLAADGDTGEVLGAYLRAAIAAEGMGTLRDWNGADATGDDIRMIAASVRPLGGDPADPIDVSTDIEISWEFENRRDEAAFNASLALHDAQGLLLFDAGSWEPPTPVAAGRHRTRCVIPRNLLNDGTYTLSLAFFDQGDTVLELPNMLRLEVLDSEEGRHGWFGEWEGAFRPRLPWSTEHLGESETLLAAQRGGG